MATAQTAFDSPRRLWRVRYAMFLPFYYCYVFMQMDKILVSLLMPVISVELRLQPKQIGLIFMVFGFAYATSALFGGLAATKFGPKRIIAIALSAYSIALWWTGATVSFLSFLLRYGIFGLAEGMEPSAAAQLLMRWYPRWQRAKVTAVWYSNVTLAPAILPFIALPVAHAVGWRWTFGLAAMTGLLGLFLCKLFIFDRPEDFHFRGRTVSEEELDEIYREEILLTQKKGIPEVSYKDVVTKPRSALAPFKSVSIWLLSIGEFLFYSGVWGVNFWLPMFFTKQLRLSMSAMGYGMTFHYGMSFVGLVLGAVIADYWGSRKRVVVFSMASSGIMLLLISQYAGSVSLFWAFAMIGLNDLFISCCHPILPPLSAEACGPDLAGSSYGITMFFGQIGTATTSFISGSLIYTVAHVQKYDHAMLYWAGCALAGSVVYSLVKEKVALRKGKLII